MIFMYREYLGGVLFCYFEFISESQSVLRLLKKTGIIFYLNLCLYKFKSMYWKNKWKDKDIEKSDDKMYYIISTQEKLDNILDEYGRVDGDIPNAVDFSYCIFKFKVNFKNFTFKKKANFSSSTFEEEVEFNNSTFKEEVNFWQVFFYKKCLFL